MIERWLERAMRVLRVALGVALVAGVLLNLGNVFGRYVLGQSILGADELQVFLMIWIAFAGAAVVTWRGEHLRMDILLDMLPPAGRRAMLVLEWALVAVLAGFAVAQSWRYVAQMLAIDRRSDALGIPIAIPHAAVLAGFAVIALIAALRFVQALRGAPPAIATRASQAERA